MKKTDLKLPFWKDYLGDLTEYTKEELEDYQTGEDAQSARWELIQEDFDEFVIQNLPSPKLDTSMGVEAWGLVAKVFLERYEKAAEMIDKIVELNELDSDEVYQHVEEYCVYAIERNERYYR